MYTVDYIDQSLHGIGFFLVCIQVYRVISPLVKVALRCVCTVDPY